MEFQNLIGRALSFTCGMASSTHSAALGLQHRRVSGGFSNLKKMSETTNPFGITRDEILNLAVEKLLHESFSDEGTSEVVRETVRSEVLKLSKASLPGLINQFLTEELSRIVNAKITPQDIWGEKAGEPTTIRDQLHKRALTFWEEKVDGKGEISHYGGYPRHEHLVRQCLQEEFSNAVKTNAAAVVSEFANALKAQGAKLVADHITKLVNVK